MGETEALFRQQEVLGPLCFGFGTRIILFLQLGQVTIASQLSYGFQLRAKN